MSTKATLITRRAAAAAVALVSVWCGAQSISAKDAQPLPAAEPQSAIVITYQATASSRPLLRREALQVLAPRLERWRRDGTLAGYRLLFNSFADRSAWDLLAILTFKDFDGIEKWRDVERSSPGGLGAPGLKVLSPTAEYLMDIVGQSRAGTGSHPGVFLVIPYVFSPTPLDRYLQYAHGYILPETEGWLRRGNVSSYGLYVNRFYPDEPLQSLLVIEYKDFDALAHREAVVAQTRKELSADAAWKAWSEAKDREHIRTEKRAVIAEQLAAR